MKRGTWGLYSPLHLDTGTQLQETHFLEVAPTIKPSDVQLISCITLSELITRGWGSNISWWCLKHYRRLVKYLPCLRKLAWRRVRTKKINLLMTVLVTPFVGSIFPYRLSGKNKIRICRPYIGQFKAVVDQSCRGSCYVSAWKGPIYAAFFY